jgi:hypothetical protein
VLQSSPQTLRNYYAQGETWTQPAAGLDNAGSQPLKLFQPVQSRFYVIAASLVCRKPGLPDHTIDQGAGEAVAFVVRQLRPKPSYTTADLATYDATKCIEYAWTAPSNAAASAQPGWTQVPQPSPEVAFPPTSLVAGEIQMPLAPSQTAGNGASRRTLVGLIPASRREQYVSAQTLGDAGGITASGAGAESSGASADASDATQDPRADMLNRTVIMPWRQLHHWWHGLSAADQSNDKTSAQISSAFILADFASFLSSWIPNVWEALQNSANTGQLTLAELALYNGMGANLQQAILKANQYEPQFEALGSADALPAGYPQFSLTDSGIIGPLSLQTRVDAALPPLGTVNQPPSPQPVPQNPTDPQGNYWFIVRCVYVRPQCAAIANRSVMSPPSQPFQLAGYYDPDAPARRVQVALPLDTSLAALRKYDKGISFLLPPELRNQMSRAASLQGLSTGSLNPPGSIGIGWICSFSIPIITICAMILLFVIVIALNLIFFWIPFFKICLPVPTLQGNK